MAFDFNWAPQKLPLQMINGRARAAADNMVGYVPNEGNPDVLGNEILAENAVDNMKGYNPNLQEQRYVGRTPQQFSNAGQGQGYTFNDPEYTQYMQEQQQAEQEAAAKEQQIADIESQISVLEKRIAENQAKLKNWNGDAVVNKIAALEARKFFSQDPTSIWRWKKDKDYATQLAAKQNGTDNTAKANAMIEIANDLDSIIVDDTMTSQDQKAYLSKLSNMKTLGEKAGVPKSVIDSINAKISEVKGENKTGSEEQPQSEYKKGTKVENADKAADELLAKPNLTQGDIAKFKRDNPNVSDEKLLELNKKHNELIDRDKKRAEADKKEAELLKKGKNLTSKDIEFLKGRKGLKYHTDDYGNEWFTKG